ncbi:PfkB family carbohydrate kinase [uncultured Jannaschia sp.]|uniref:PfkB family carbohydrate kinase n=1 Tax=uncultured Jannaschia sp. TaxID=293347 RepID=UPI0026220D0A|nr:PfkB family carbohydrate kinase [uncultured Jannaschia sp.]
MVATLEAALAGAATGIVSDYGYGKLCREVIITLAVWRRAERGRLVADARDLGRLAWLAPCAVTPNEAATAAAALAGIAAGQGDAAARIAALAGADLPARTGAAAVIATLDRDGAVVLRAGCGTLHLLASRAVERADVTGAGEIFAAALALTLAAGAGIAVAARLACAAAGVAVAKPGTATCSVAELRAALAGPVVRPLPAVSRSAGEASALGRAARAADRFHNGCFDILHEGQMAYLEEARALDDLLIVG